MAQETVLVKKENIKRENIDEELYEGLKRGLQDILAGRVKRVR